MGIFFVYILKSSVCLVVFYLFYRLLLSRETFHRFNRFALFQPGGATEHSVVIVPFTIGRGNRRGADRSSSNHDDFRTVADAGRYDEHG